MSHISPISPNVFQISNNKNETMASPIAGSDFLRSLVDLSKGVKMITVESNASGALALFKNKHTETEELKPVSEYIEEDIKDHLDELVKMIEKLTKES